MISVSSYRFFTPRHFLKQAVITDGLYGRSLVWHNESTLDGSYMLNRAMIGAPCSPASVGDILALADATIERNAGVTLQ